MAARATAAVVLVVLVFTWATDGSSAKPSASAKPTASAPALAPEPSRGTGRPHEPWPDKQLLWPGSGFYPRIIRLEHAGAADGTLVATVVSKEGGDWAAAIFHSTDQGRSFKRVGWVKDPAGRAGMCCHTLYELPSRIGELPAGTLLWAGTFGADRRPESARRMSERVWQSTDQGRTWRYLSTISTARTAQGTWEPEFTVGTGGRLIVFYSDQTDPRRHSQKLVQARTEDGVRWGDFRDVVAIGERAAEPGMAVVRRMADRAYLMSYEVCKGRHQCEVYVRRSADGWNWGRPADIGERVRTVAGRYPASTPTITMLGDTVLLNAKRLRNADGSFAPVDGRTLLGNARNGSGHWFEVIAPVPLADPEKKASNDIPCPGYSNPLLGSPGGRWVLQITTDVDRDGICRAYVKSTELKIRVGNDAAVDITDRDKRRRR